MPTPVHRKNNHIHQPEIVWGNEIFISHSPIELICTSTRTVLNWTTPLQINGYAFCVVELTNNSLSRRINRPREIFLP